MTEPQPSGTWSMWTGRLSELGYASALYDAVFGELSRAGARGALGARAHRVLWTRLVDRDLPPGARFFEEDLAALVGVSRPPVREAVARLVEEGLLDRHGRGIQVHVFTAAQVGSLYCYRAILERHAARASAGSLGPDAIAGLRAQQDRLREQLRARAPRYVVDYLLADLQLHDTILAASANEYLLASMRRIRGQLSLFQTDGMRREADVRLSLDEHTALLRALADGDPDRAAAAVHAHVLDTGHRIVASMARPEGA